MLVLQESVILQRDGDARSLHASRTIKKGETFLVEDARLSIPDPGIKFGGNGYDELESYYALSRRPAVTKICVGCYSCLNTEEYESCHLCSSPICSQECQNSSLHADECQILATIREDASYAELLDSERVVGQIFYDFLSVIRVLNFKKKLYQLKIKLANYLEIEDRYRKGPFTNIREDDIKTFTLLFQALESVCSNFSVDHCFTALTAIKVFGIPQNAEENHYSRIFSFQSSFIRHSCVPNVDIGSNKAGRIKVKALKNINEGEELLCSFVNTLRPTYERHVVLQVQYLTECNCERCVDPTEFQTYLGSVKCENLHCDGSSRTFVVMDTDQNLKKCMTYDKWVWKCLNCNTKVDHTEMTKTMDAKAADINLWPAEKQVDFSFMKEQVDLINHPYSTFHSCHWLPLLLAKRLSALMGLSYGVWNFRVDVNTLAQKTSILKQQLQVYSKLQCGSSPSAAVIKAELLDLDYVAKCKGESTGSELSDEEKQIVYENALEIYECLNHYDPSSMFGSALGIAHRYMQKDH